MMVTDGTGPASINMARSYFQHINKDSSLLLELDRHMVGSSRTRSSSSLITDSAAGATAFSCALKSYNGAIGVDEHQKACLTILEALKLKGYKTGLVVTTSVTDATPAAFSSHVNYRSMQSEIAMQQLGINAAFTAEGGSSIVDLMFGGGSCFFLPGSDVNGCRSDEENLFSFAKSHGWDVAMDKAGFDKWAKDGVKLPALGLHAFYNVPYEIDREDDVNPSLYDQTVLALKTLSEATKDSDEGFFLMIEGSRIDHAGHHNDAHAQVREVLAYDKAFKAVIDFIDEADVETIMVSTSDHETGGLTVGKQVGKDYPEYLWEPQVLDNAQASGEQIGKDLLTFMNTAKPDIEDIKQYIIQTVFHKQLGLKIWRNDEFDELIELIKQGAIGDAVEALKLMVNDRAHVGFTTHGHTAVDVNIYAHSNTDIGKMLIIDGVGGNRENIEIGDFLAEIGNVTIGTRLDYHWEQPCNPHEESQVVLEMPIGVEEDELIEEEIEKVEAKMHGFGDHMAEDPQDTRADL